VVHAHTTFLTALNFSAFHSGDIIAAPSRYLTSTIPGAYRRLSHLYFADCYSATGIDISRNKRRRIKRLANAGDAWVGRQLGAAGLRGCATLFSDVRVALAGTLDVADVRRGGQTNAWTARLTAATLMAPQRKDHCLYLGPRFCWRAHASYARAHGAQTRAGKALCPATLLRWDGWLVASRCHRVPPTRSALRFALLPTHTRLLPAASPSLPSPPLSPCTQKRNAARAPAAAHTHCTPLPTPSLRSAPPHALHTHSRIHLASAITYSFSCSSYLHAA